MTALNVAVQELGLARKEFDEASKEHYELLKASGEAQKRRNHAREAMEEASQRMIDAAVTDYKANLMTGDEVRAAVFTASDLAEMTTRGKIGGGTRVDES